MTLTHYELGLTVDLCENKHSVVVIENPQIMNRFISEMKSQIDGKEGGFILSDRKDLALDKSADFMIDLWNIDSNTKKVKTRLLQLAKEIADEFFFDSFITLRTEVFSFLERVREKIPYSIDYNINIDSQELLKMMDVHIDIEAVTFLEQLVEYLKLNADLCGIKFFVVLNLQMCLTNEELVELYKELELHKIVLLDIEGHFSRNAMACEKIIVIDKDNCIITV